MAKYVFKRTKTGETKTIIAGSYKLALIDYIASRKAGIDAANADKKVNTLRAVDVTENGGDVCISIDGRPVNYQFDLLATWYKPTEMVTEAAKIDTRMDGGRLGSMGMIGR